ncbi:6,7-dimethyl-8-ribityllumazine synthase [bacterium]|nr:6,7-dimethyl-8-ribityllumazine synthase [bacterium]
MEKTFPIALVVSRFNEEVTSRLVQGAVDRLRERGFTEEQIKTVYVPGAVEIPLVAQRLARSKRYQAIIALGAVIRGETTHYDYVCEQVSQGCQKIALECDLPVIFGVLTTENDAQAFDRVGGQHGHKGRDAADSAIEMTALLASLD